MSYGIKSGGTRRTKKTVDGVRVDVVTACCEGCRIDAHDSGRTAAEARGKASQRGWLILLLRQRTAFGGETRVWRVLCPSCRNTKGPAAAKLSGTDRA